VNKKELEKKKEQKKRDKLKRKEDRKASGGSKSFEDMIAYVDENGMITSTPPDLRKKQEVDVNSIVISSPKIEKTEPEPLKGRVEHFNETKGYGFIKDLQSVNKYFFHISNAPSDIAEGDQVSFSTEKSQRGMNAVNIEHLT
jgi:cold shock CspA family protein